jgi:hypothetical protein
MIPLEILSPDPESRRWWVYLRPMVGTVDEQQWPMSSLDFIVTKPQIQKNFSGSVCPVSLNHPGVTIFALSDKKAGSTPFTADLI